MTNGLEITPTILSASEPINIRSSIWGTTMKQYSQRKILVCLFKVKIVRKTNRKFLKSSILSTFWTK